jgi:hypothetical protein
MDVSSTTANISKRYYQVHLFSLEDAHGSEEKARWMEAAM